MILVNDVYKREHRVVWEQANLTTIRKGAHIHHINQDKLDNEPDNLLLLTATEHAQVHRAIDHKAWRIAIHILKRAAKRQLYYPKEVDLFVANHDKH